FIFASSFLTIRSYSDGLTRDITFSRHLQLLNSPIIHVHAGTADAGHLIRHSPIKQSVEQAIVGAVLPSCAKELVIVKNAAVRNKNFFMAYKLKLYVLILVTSIVKLQRYINQTL